MVPCAPHLDLLGLVVSQRCAAEALPGRAPQLFGGLGGGLGFVGFREGLEFRLSGGPYSQNPLTRQTNPRVQSLQARARIVPFF